MTNNPRQTHDTLPFRLQLTPMQLPESAYQPIDAPWEEAESALGKTGDSKKRKGCELVLYPGESSEILVQLENLTNQTLSVEFTLDGTFPHQWCRVHGEGNEIPPRGTMEVLLYFHVAADFFESPHHWQVGQSLVLDYQGQLQIHSQLQGESDSQAESARDRNRQYHVTAPFALFVRPRSLYLNYLPELFREVDFIGRLLKLFEEAFEPDFNTLLSLWGYLHPLTAPEAMLPFLAHWVGWQWSPALSQQKQRRLIARAMELYRWRGTRWGLRQYLHFYTDLPLDEHLPEAEKHICIQELGGQGFVLGEAEMGGDALIGGGQPYHFIVRLRHPSDQWLDERLIRNVIEQEKPAFCTYELYIVEERENAAELQSSST
ncbi:phage tail protein [Spirulina sp. CS-785/01]|uniref:phage tail protein n=1 Tax=Spirulina sp. CS-785/01 TaxID=3021716 RepID=UPI002330D984|nr:phage tail protein [Spirulina sp. CS-785/01]MDB9312795.1 phage tail protein [Spirulina sp. CS-785/01]